MKKALFLIANFSLEISFPRDLPRYHPIRIHRHRLAILGRLYSQSENNFLYNLFAKSNKIIHIRMGTRPYDDGMGEVEITDSEEER